jgi:hypothetical protein
MTVESHAAGAQLSMLLYKLPSDQRLAFLQLHLPRLAEAAAMIATLLRDRGLDSKSAESWVEHAKHVTGLAAQSVGLPDKYSGWTGHGDCTVENILFDADTNRMTVIDWEYVRRGLPPLYDLITLFLSVLSAVVPPASVSASLEDPGLAQFYTAFFHENEWSALFRTCVLRACERLEVDRAQTWDMFVDALVLRIGYLIERKSALRLSRIGFIESISDWRGQFQL